MDTFLWTVGATSLIAVAGYGITIFFIHPIRDLQKILDEILHLLVEYTDVYGVARHNKKYQAREAFRQSARRLEEAKKVIPLYWLWGLLGPVPTQQKVYKAKKALRMLADLAVQIIDQQADLSKRQAERAQVMKEATRQEEIVKICLRLKEYALFRDL